jgi:hypothetical protein
MYSFSDVVDEPVALAQVLAMPEGYEKVFPDVLGIGGVPQRHGTRQKDE